MDTKNDDSAGSDSLDKSLQKKCVVDDAGDGVQLNACVSAAGAGVSADKTDCKPANADSTIILKTVKNAGDGENKAAGGKTAAQQQIQPDDDKVSKDSTTTTIKAASTSIDGDNTHKESIAATLADSDTTSTTSSTCSTSSSSNSSPGKAFETKVKQISKNLKETTLADAAANQLPEVWNTLGDVSTSSGSSEEDSNSLEYEQQTVDGDDGDDKSASSKKSLPAAQVSTPNSSDTILQPDDAELETSLCSTEANDDEDTLNHRSKKVRFHPDVKENDGGNRVIPKKKKKMKDACGTEEHYPAKRLDFEMELDEEEDEEISEEFDLAKTIAEAQDYLKLHPLTFARPQENGGARLQDGLLEEEDLRNMSESSEEEDVYEDVKPENNVARILGKQVKNGKVEFLLRYADRTGLFWVTEDFVWKQCPSIYNAYENNRERRQQRLMRHVAKRQNIRQRYTDF